VSHTADEIRETRSTLSDQVNSLLKYVSSIAGSLNYSGADLSYIKDRVVDQERAGVLDWVSNSTDPSETTTKPLDIKNRVLDSGSSTLIDIRTGYTAQDCSGSMAYVS
jgi:hypothetical protein